MHNCDIFPEYGQIVVYHEKNQVALYAIGFGKEYCTFCTLTICHLCKHYLHSLKKHKVKYNKEINQAILNVYLFLIVFYLLCNLQYYICNKIF